VGAAGRLSRICSYPPEIGFWVDKVRLSRPVARRDDES
jgi:hypothetical protein